MVAIDDGVSDIDGNSDVDHDYLCGYSCSCDCDDAVIFL